MTKYLS